MTAAPSASPSAARCTTQMHRVLETGKSILIDLPTNCVGMMAPRVLARRQAAEVSARGHDLMNA